VNFEFIYAKLFRKLLNSDQINNLVILKCYQHGLTWISSKQ